MRDQFSVPRDVAYLNAAAYAPLPNVVRDAAVAGATGKAAPWALDRSLSEATAERVRGAVARLIGAGADDIAIMGSVSHAIATAARALPIPAGHRILRVAGEHSSQALEWQRLAAATGAVVDVVPRPSDDDWTAAVLERIETPGLPPIAVAALTMLHWTDGSLIDLDRIAPALRAQGAALVVDATQSAGVMPIDVAQLRPDFLAFPTYKWTLGPYNLAFLYAVPHRQHGEPLDRNGFNSIVDDACIDVRFQPGARRYDMGERNNPVALPMSEAALSLVLGWGVAAVQAHARGLTEALAREAAALGLAGPRFRAPHVLGLRLEPGATARAVAGLAALGVHVSDRQGVMRISPHVYNDEDDVRRFAAALATLVPGG